MESRIYNLVHEMHQKFGFDNKSGPTILNEDEKAFRIAALEEELSEFQSAKTLVDQYDALLDLIVFAVGTLDRMGLPLLEGFEEVMKCNMAKEVGQNGNKRGGFKRDLVKPHGWTGPEAKLQDIIINRCLENSTDQQTRVCIDSQPMPQASSTVAAPSSDGNIVPGYAPKFDADKVRVDLVPIGPVTQIAAVFTFGAKKYFADSYRQGETVAWSRTYGSILRHLYAFWSGEDTDPESGLPHLAHAGTQLMILMEHYTYNKNKDDRFKRA